MIKDEPIIGSMLDLDFYKPNMMQLQFERHRDVPVRFSFINRSKDVRLADIVPEEALREEFDHVRTLRHSDAQLEFYRSQGLYSERFLAFQRGLALPEIGIEKRDGQYLIETFGKWPEATPWETMVLSIMNELYYRALLKRDGLDDAAGIAKVERIGEQRLLAKIALLKKHPRIIRFMEFGTRRRFSRKWQKRVVEILLQELPGMLVGTSNAALAMLLGIAPKGTMAHELFMAYACIYGLTDEGLLGSHNKVLQDWEALYVTKLLIALTDTFGSDFFFRDMTPTQAERWSGMRHDSGEVLAFGDRQITFYERLGIDQRTKILTPSDGLNVPKMIRIDNHFDDRIQVVDGIGTDFTNDICYPALSIVMKLTEAAGRKAVKLSDDPGKHLGPPEEVARYKRVFGYGAAA